jgi:hypothetical protein
MGKEILAIPEEHLVTVILILRTGCDRASLWAVGEEHEVICNLREWCNEIEKYLLR